jgi:hypothetical protein
MRVKRQLVKKLFVMINGAKRAKKGSCQDGPPQKVLIWGPPPGFYSRRNQRSALPLPVFLLGDSHHYCFIALFGSFPAASLTLLIGSIVYLLPMNHTPGSK